MTIIEKLSDRNSFIFKAIKMVLVNNPEKISAKTLQWQLFQAGVYIDGKLLKQALSVMSDKGELSGSPNEQKKESKIVTDAVFQKESEA